MVAQYYSCCPIARLYPRRNEPALTPHRQRREYEIRDMSVSEAINITQHFLHYQCGNGLRDTLRDMRKALLAHTENRTRILTIDDYKARQRHFNSAKGSNWYTACTRWPYQLRRLISENMMPALVAAKKVNPDINFSFYKIVICEILGEINHLDERACELPFIDRMLMPWESLLEQVLCKLEQIAASIRLEVGPSE